MADIELVIKIDSSTYDICKSVRNLPLDENDIMSSLIMQSIANGIPLAKHDAEVIKKTIESIFGLPTSTDKGETE